ncbi:Alpha-1,6-mannosylglycoprotein 6-beta-N-acetylglucosaminyltransferase A [Liparis tanakae]|uniref:alpha-1,6-mannosyl-glycoprotein 6-beta-N-acetylglucosaminyltransferase n=1 Tax=Liparis tanakae TaxID=230148 RepID=A0A4Z2EA69_9TELE|nr:Alpha-1,6-mannosylglycoprotein 6-beta-N-acetylglucosaminyltransferase A [Liparis tanakae]
MLRVLDSFGTEPEFNHAHYAQSKGHKTPWGKWNLNPQQFNTMFRKWAQNTAGELQKRKHRNAIWLNGGASAGFKISF